MSYIYNSFDCFYYEKKTVMLKMADFLNQGVYTLFNGKRVKLYENAYGDDEYKILKDKSLRYALLISVLVLPLLLITIPLKLISLEQQKIRKEIERLDDQKRVMNQLRRKMAVAKIEQAFKNYQLKKRKKAALIILQAFRVYKAEKQRVEPAVIKIQRAFREYQKNQKKKVEANKKPLLERIVQKGKDYVAPYIPYMKQTAKKMVVNYFMDAMFAGACAAIGVNYADVKLANKIQNFNDELAY